MIFSHFFFVLQFEFKHQHQQALEKTIGQTDPTVIDKCHFCNILERIFSPERDMFYQRYRCTFRSTIAAGSVVVILSVSQSN